MAVEGSSSEPMAAVRTGAVGLGLQGFGRSRDTAGDGLPGAEVLWRGHCWHPWNTQLLQERGCLVCGMSPACHLP